MLIYTILIGLIIIGQVFIWSKMISAKKYCIFICICMILIAGLRDKNLGLYDMVNGYLPAWHWVGNHSWEDIMKVSLSGKTALKDIGYAYLTKIMSYGPKSDQWFIFFSSIPYLAASSGFIYKHSKICGLSFLLFIGLNYFTSCYYLIHHIWATTFLIIAVEELLKNNIKYFVILTLIACLFHASAIVFLILLINYQQKLNFSHYALMGLSVVVGVFGKEIIITLLSFFIGKESRWYYYLNDYSTDSLARWFLAFACLACAIVYEKKLVSRNINNRVFINMGVWCCVFYAFTPIISEIHRFARFFGIADIILVSNSVYECGNTKRRIILSILIVFIFCIYLFRDLFSQINAAPYCFFWEK